MTSRPDGPNVVLIVLDTARADVLEPYGGGAGASPVLGDLARRGAVVRQATSPANWTMPSHASFLTGLLPRSMGLLQVPGGAQSVPAQLAPYADLMLPAVLQRAGWSTRGVSCNLWVSQLSGFDHGYDEWVDVRTARRAKILGTSWRERFAWDVEAAAARVDAGAEQAREVTRRWLAAQPRPFFWFVNLLECHSPYLPPRPYNDLGPRVRRQVAREAREHLTLETIWKASLGVREVPADALSRMRHLYGRSILALDAWLGSLLEDLDERKVLDDTLVIVTSDHGENLGESGYMGHCFSLDQRLLHVPLVSAGPGAFEGDVVSLSALPSFVAAATGLRDHPYGEPACPPGVAVAQHDRLTVMGSEEAEGVRVSWDLGELGMRRLTSSQTAVTDGRWKLVDDGGDEHLYDLAADPFEVAPLDAAASTAAPTATLRQLLATARDQQAIATPKPVATALAAPAADVEDLEDRMRLLGYM